MLTHEPCYKIEKYNIRTVLVQDLSQVDLIELHTNDGKQEEPKNIFVSADTSVRLLVKKREWARLITSLLLPS